MNTNDNTHNTHSDNAEQPAATDPMGDRVSVLLGDRLCVKCGFNLHGQTIAREEHYNMLAVRCPECFTVASLQEYPTLGPWATRFGLVLAMAWVVCILTLAFLTGLTFYASAEGVAGVATIPAARQIGLAFEEYRQANPEPDDSGSLYAVHQNWGVGYDSPEYNNIDPDWLEEQEINTITADSATGRYQFKALGATIPFVLGTAFWGVLWSILLLHRRLRGKLVAMSIIVGLSSALLVLSHWGPTPSWGGSGMWSNYYWGWGIPAQTIATHIYGLGPALITVAIGFAAMIPGLMWGRVIVRWLVRLLMPPHLRGPLAVLWHVDGLPSPSTRGEFWVRG